MASQKKRKRKRRAQGPSASASGPTEDRAGEETAANGGATAGDPFAPVSGATGRGRSDLNQTYRDRAKTRNAAARETLEPLGPGERPLVITIGGVVCALLALFSIVAYVAQLKLASSNEPPGLVPTAVYVALIGTMTVGLFRRRYWAVLGFQALLALFLIFTSLYLIGSHSVLQALGFAVAILAAGALFWFNVKAMARIQMPSRQRDTR